MRESNVERGGVVNDGGAVNGWGGMDEVPFRGDAKGEVASGDAVEGDRNGSVSAESVVEGDSVQTEKTQSGSIREEVARMNAELERILERISATVKEARENAQRYNEEVKREQEKLRAEIREIDEKIRLKRGELEEYPDTIRTARLRAEDAAEGGDLGETGHYVENYQGLVQEFWRKAQEFQSAVDERDYKGVDVRNRLEEGELNAFEQEMGELRAEASDFRHKAERENEEANDVAEELLARAADNGAASGARDLINRLFG